MDMFGSFFITNDIYNTFYHWLQPNLDKTQEGCPDTTDRKIYWDIDKTKQPLTMHTQRRTPYLTRSLMNIRARFHQLKITI